ncbi:MAG: DUF4340 domain-containing protein [Nitrosomonas sp.]|nr:DUF4340 domain-containing protein [Nitrosomonas sp.]
MAYLFGGIVEEDEFMNYHAKLNRIMLVTVIGLGLFLFFKPSSEDAEVYALSSLSADAAEHIEIGHRENVITLQKIKNRWYLTAPFRARTDEAKVEQVLEILSSKSQHRLPLGNLNDFGLDKPNIQLQINQEKFSFGGLTPITNEQYVAVGENIYLLPPRYSVMLPSQPSKIVSTKLLAETEIPVGLEVRDLRVGSNESASLMRQDETGGWVELWQTAKATHVYFSADALVGETQKEIKITLRNGQHVEFKLQRNETELILLRVDEGMGYVFPNELGKQLIDFPDNSPT